jgi:dTDP-4-dehydrorhamnose 3,5-epimerase
LHYQVAPHGEVKLVRCIRGAICDVVLDLRPGSPTYLQHATFELTAANHRALYVPEMLAHGYLTLSDDSEVFYHVSEAYHGPSERGVCYRDALAGIRLPREVTLVSQKDLSWPALRDERMADARR